MRVSLTLILASLSTLLALPAVTRADTSLVAAVLPASRAVAVSVTATAFATVINSGAAAAQGCSIALPPGIPATFSYQRTDPNTNALVGSPNTPVTIDAGAIQTFVFAITPTSTFSQTNIALVFACTSGQTAAPINGVNTFLLTSSATATPDVVALAATVSNDGIVRTPGTQAIAAFSVATINVGAAGAVTANVDSGGVALPATFVICQTDAQAQCLQAPASEVTTNFGAGQTGTFSIFVTSTGTVIPLDPAQFRSFVRFRLANATSVGATSVAVQTQITLGTGGGTLQIGDVGVQASGQSAVSPVDFAVAPTGVPATPPAGATALNRAYNVTLTNVDNAPDHGLNSAVSLTLPYGGLGVADPNSLAVLHFDPGTQTYEPTTIRSIDTNAQTITVDSRQFSTFVLSLLSPLFPDVVDTIGFAPLLNGFQTPNLGNAYLSPNGNCLGMSAFSIWYFRNRSFPDVLFNHYSGAGAPNSVADLVATRAHIMQSVYWNNLYQTDNSLPWQTANQAEVVKKMKAHLAFFRRPLVTIVGTAPGRTDHAMVIYGYDANNFFIYDPNVVGTPQTVAHSGAGFGTYAGFTSWTMIGFPSFGGSENFAQIAFEGDGGFASSSNITIIEPASGDTINDRQTQLRGSLGGGLNGLSSAAVLLNGITPFQNIPVAGGAFNKTIDVASGQNTVVFIAGVQAYNGQLSTTLPNSAVLIRKFNGPTAALFRSTARWNQNNTDVDQYVTEPTGETSWYADHTTAAGLTLDFDNTSGFGPENTTLETTKTPIPGVYKVRLHYFSDHGTDQAASGSVTILLHERQPDQKVATRLWIIGIANASNDAPSDSGPDWVDIANVDVVNNSVTFP